MSRIASFFRPASIALLFAAAVTLRAEEISFQTSWFNSGDQPVLRLQPGRFAISPNSPALRQRGLIRVTDASTGRPVPFDVISSANSDRRLGAIDLLLSDSPLPRRINVTVSGLILEDRAGRRLTSGGSAIADVPSATISPIGPLRRFHRGGRERGFAGPSDLPPDVPPQRTLAPDVPNYRGPVTVAGGAAPTPAPSKPPKQAEPPKQITAATPPETAIPAFPFPPPTASAFEVVPRKLIIGDNEHPLLQDARDALSFAFDECGYGEKSYYAVPDGFAMASRIEQIDGEGAPSDERWSLEVQPIRTPSLKSYLQALFRARPGRYRVIVFLVTNHWFDQTEAKVSSDEASSWVTKGANELPEDIGQRDYTREHACTAMIYEFKCIPGHKPEFVEPSQITGHMHLTRTGFFAALEKASTR